MATRAFAVVFDGQIQSRLYSLKERDELEKIFQQTGRVGSHIQEFTVKPIFAKYKDRNNSAFEALIMQRMEAVGIKTVRELAATIKAHRVSFYKWFTGERTPNLKYIGRLAVLLDVPESDLIEAVSITVAQREGTAQSITTP